MYKANKKFDIDRLGKVAGIAIVMKSNGDSVISDDYLKSCPKSLPNIMMANILEMSKKDNDIYSSSQKLGAFTILYLAAIYENRVEVVGTAYLTGGTVAKSAHRHIRRCWGVKESKIKEVVYASEAEIAWAYGRRPKPPTVKNLGEISPVPTSADGANCDKEK